MEDSENRRGAPRWRGRQEVLGDIVNLGLARVGRGFPARTEDVSHSGLRLRTPIRLEPGDRIRLAFPSDRPEIPALAVEADVLWVRPPKLRSLGKWMAGLSFRPVEQPDIAPVIERARNLNGMYSSD